MMFGKLCLLYGREMEESAATAYWQNLQDLGIVRIGDAMGKATKQDEFFPTVAKLRKYAGVGLPEYLRPTTEVKELPPVQMTQEQQKEVQGWIKDLAEKLSAKYE